MLKKEFDGGEELRRLLLRFTQALIIQTEQITIGNRHHTVEQRLSHFLLMILDRLSGIKLQITHAQVSIFLGVRRENITVAAQKLEALCAIRYRRGHMAVINPQELEKLAGENYAVVSKEYRRLQEYPILAVADSRIA